MQRKLGHENAVWVEKAEKNKYGAAVNARKMPRWERRALIGLRRVTWLPEGRGL